MNKSLLRLRPVVESIGRGLAKNTAHIETQFALANLWMARELL
ncbi:hypothetical protein [Paraburkholderia caribensis]